MWMKGLDLALANTRSGGNAGFKGRGSVKGTSSRSLAKIPLGLYVMSAKDT